MKRLDKILDFFFHSAVGVCLLLGVGVFAAMTMTGCIVFDSLSCICDQSCGQGCGDCWAGCDRACYEVVTCGADDNCSCDWVKCAFGHGCTGNCTENYKTTCGGCDRTFFTECDSCNCEGEGCSVKICNFTCLKVIPTYDITVIFQTDDADYSNVEWSIPKDKRDSISDLGMGWKFSTYFTVKGWYDTADFRTLVVKEDGTVVKKDAIKDNARLYAKLTENKVGERVLLKFNTDAYPGLIINPVEVTVGAAIPHLETPSVAGRTFLGWRVAGSDRDAVMLQTGDIFHLYTLLAGQNNVVTLEPVFSGGGSSVSTTSTPASTTEPTKETTTPEEDTTESPFDF